MAGFGVRQTDFTFGSGNALQACVATIFRQPLEHVLNFITAAGGYKTVISQWAAEHGHS